MKSGLLTLLSFLAFITSFAQSNMYFYNSGLEGTPAPHVVPAPWLACYGSPDTQPGQWGITLAAEEGNTYVSFLQSGQSPNGYSEGMTQLVFPCLQQGVQYAFTVNLAHSNIYITSSPNGCYSSLEVYGGNTQCSRTQKLWSSPAFYDTTWQTYSISFTPTSNWCYVSFSPYFVSACGGGNGYVNVLMDAPGDENLSFIDIQTEVPAQFSLYPNPANLQITIRMAHPLDEDMRILVVNTVGQVIQEMQAPAGQTEIQVNTSQLVSGTYTLQLFGKTTFQQQKFIRE